MKRPVVVMGVSASGKTTVGRELARAMDARFIDADDLHSESNVEKMRAGIALEDEDRWPWLALVGRALVPGTVIACSALKRSHRDALRAQSSEPFFALLMADPSTLRERAAARTGHFMPANLLQSQLDALEPLGEDEEGVVIDVSGPPDQAAHRILESLRAAAG